METTNTITAHHKVLCDIEKKMEKFQDEVKCETKTLLGEFNAARECHVTKKRHLKSRK